jgi:carbamoyltransferase
MKILGISAYYHDSAAALVDAGQIVAAAQEERFSRKKHDARFPGQATAYCLAHGQTRIADLDYIVFYDKPLAKFDRLLETYLAYAPRGLRSFVTAMPAWLREKLFMKRQLRRGLAALGGCAEAELPPLLFTQHHQSHAAAAFYPSPFHSAAVLCMDGVGEWATTSAWLGAGNRLSPLWEVHFPHSLGMLYSAFTYYTGFKVNSGEYKLMGLAPYGTPRYAATIRDHLIDVKDDGSFRLDMRYFDYASGLTMTNARFDALFGGPPRQAETALTQREMDLAASVQLVTEEVVLKIARAMHAEMGVDHLCLAGGVALNCVANGRLLREGPFKEIWVQPAAGDAGGALGAALAIWHDYLDNERAPGDGDSMQGSYLGPHYTNEEIEDALRAAGARYSRLDDAVLMTMLAGLLDAGNVVGWFQGRMEFGPRALGARSIIGDPRNARMQATMNLKIKYRESFRPFAPAVLHERVQDYFELDRASPYMLLVAPVKHARRIDMSTAQQDLFGVDKLNVPRSDLPAITHVDYSARVQTVHRATNPRFHQLLEQFERSSGCAVLVNTSFNVRGEPVVCTPQDAYRCFMSTEMDYLVLENCLLAKSAQPTLATDTHWRTEYELD